MTSFFLYMQQHSSSTCIRSVYLAGFVTRLTRRVPLLVEQELLTLHQHLNSLPVLVGFVLLDLQFYVYVWLLCCLFFFDIRILITPWVSSNSSHNTGASIEISHHLNNVRKRSKHNTPVLTMKRLFSNKNINIVQIYIYVKFIGIVIILCVTKFYQREMSYLFNWSLCKPGVCNITA